MSDVLEAQLVGLGQLLAEERNRLLQLCCCRQRVLGSKVCRGSPTVEKHIFLSQIGTPTIPVVGIVRLLLERETSRPFLGSHRARIKR